jgi:hypothetical protein
VNLAPLSPEQHAGLRVRPHASYEFVRGSIAIALFRSEVVRAAHEFPIVFTAEADGYFPAALMGLTPGCNAFVDAQGRWLAGYVPAIWRRGAFRLAKIEGREEWVLCLDLDSELLGTDEGQPLFDGDGKPTALIGHVMQFLSQMEADRQATLHASATLDRHGLLVPFELNVKKEHGSAQRLEGIFKVDEARLNALPGDALAELQSSGGLAMVFAHLFSLLKLPLLGRLAGDRDAEAQRKEALESGKLDLDRLFGIVEDDPFIF